MEQINVVCPSCGSEYVHQDSCEVFFREEDAENGLHSLTDKEDMFCYNDISMYANPSPRRDGVTIGFWCEGCKDKFNMHIYQHKGVTVVKLAVIKPYDDIAAETI